MQLPVEAANLAYIHTDHDVVAADGNADGAGHGNGHNEERQEHDAAQPHALDRGGDHAPHRRYDS